MMAPMMMISAIVGLLMRIDAFDTHVVAHAYAFARAHSEYDAVDVDDDDDDDADDDLLTNQDVAASRRVVGPAMPKAAISSLAELNKTNGCSSAI